MVDYALMNQCLYEGKAKEVGEMTEQALADGRTPQEILTNGLIAGMSVVGEDFKHNVLYVPEVLIAARAMKAGMAVLKPLLSASENSERIGTLLMGTVRGDLHDIGKNLVCMMAEGAGFEVHDIGVDQSVEKFLAAADQYKPDIIGMSALLTTTMTYMNADGRGGAAGGGDAPGRKGRTPLLRRPLTSPMCLAVNGSCEHPRLAVAMVLLFALGGCGLPAVERGLSGRDAEWARAHSPGEFSVVSASHDRAVVSALGHQVAVEPAEGFCLASSAIETSDRSAFLLLGDCALEDPAGNESGAEGQLDLPRGVPGIITVSISGDPGFSRLGAEGDLSELQAFLQTPDGRALLGRGGEGDQVSVVDTQQIGQCLYVLVEDADGGVPVLAPRFWRAFVELNDRLAVVTISGFRDRPLPETEMLRYLGDQVRQLQVANSEPVDEAPVQFAESGRDRRTPELPFLAPRTEEDAIEEEAEDGVPAITDIKPTSIIVAKEGGEQDFWPVPARRRAATTGQGGARSQSGSAARLPASKSVDRSSPPAAVVPVARPRR